MSITRTGFNESKAAQICAYFASREATLVIEKLKLIKLVYLAERAFMAKHGIPMLLDDFYSLPHGPVCSSTLDGINGIQNDRSVWQSCIQKLNYKDIKAELSGSRENFDEISDAEFKIISETWSIFGSMTASEIRNYSHDSCAEYVDVKMGRRPISYKSIYDALDISEAEFLHDESLSIKLAQSVLAP